MSLTLHADNVESPARWRWRLTDSSGRTITDHQVDLDTGSADYQAFGDLYRYVQRNRLPDDRVGSEAAIVDRLGRWIGTHVLGPIGPLLDDTVRVILPREGDFLLTRPLELAFVDGSPLARRGVTLVYQFAQVTAASKRPVGDRLRILALFSMPSRASVLALRRERYELARTVREIASTSGKAIELRVLQYGVTRERLRRTIEEHPGWDVLHVSGHGDRGALLLEKPNGSPDVITTAELVNLLRPARHQLKLAVLLACNSGASAAAATMRNLRLDDAADQLEQQAGGPETPPTGLARGLVDQLGIATVAMRYPVVDTFAVQLTQELYPTLLGAGQPIDRALALSVPRAAGDAPSAGRPALSVGTPALFGPAVGLAVAPPSGAAVLDPFAERLAGFPAEAVRFVGRTPALIAASQALAPASGLGGVLFVGMAGAGKTACAVELSHAHRGRFRAMAWWQAPTQPDEFGQALSLFAHAVEAQLGIPMMQAAGSETSLRAFLPHLRALLKEEAILLVLDNLETLLTDSGGWREPLWAPLIDALLGHGGLSRTVLTSRVRPSGVDGRALTVPTHALSLAESVLLARELPNLSRLLHDEPAVERSPGQVTEDRELARRVLNVVQGHPKLLELADAAATDSTALAGKVTAAEAAGQGTPVQTFFTAGHSDLDGGQFLRVLGGWTTAALTSLPAPARTLAELLAFLEDDDRQDWIVDSVWPHLPGSDPLVAVDDALTPLVSGAIIEIIGPDPTEPDSPTEYRLHPGVAEAIRASAPTDLGAQVDELLAQFWWAINDHGADLEAHGTGAGGPLIVRAGLSGAPYLLRRHLWVDASYLLEAAAQRDASPGVTRRILAYLGQILDGQTDPDRRLIDDGVYASVLTRVDPPAAQARLRAGIDAARTVGQPSLAAASARQLANLLLERGDLTAALSAVGEMTELHRAAGAGPWTQAADEAQRLQILGHMSQHRETLDQATTLLTHLDTLPTTPGPDDSQVQLWNIREATLGVAFQAAWGVGDWNQALDLNRRRLASMNQRGTSAHEQARLRFNDYGPLLQLGRIDDAERLLLACQHTFDDAGDIAALGTVYSARADLEDERGRPEAAITLGQAALRYGYSSPAPDNLATRHFNLAVYLARTSRDPRHIIAHRLAAALLRRATGRTTNYAENIRALAAELRSHGGEHLPTDLADLVQLVESVEGVHFGQLLAALIPDQHARETLLTEAISAARDTPAHDPAERVRQQWAPNIEAIVAAAQGNSEAAEAVETSLLSLMAQDQDWAELAGVLRRIIAGERDPALLHGLDATDTIIVQTILGKLNDEMP